MPEAPHSSCEANMSLDIAWCPLGGTMSLVENQWVRRMISSSATSSKAEELGSVWFRTQKKDISSIPCRKIHFFQMWSCYISTIVHTKTTWGDFKNLYAQATPWPVKPEFWGVGMGISIFKNLSPLPFPLSPWASVFLKALHVSPKHSQGWDPLI